jgi:cell division protease FtsH
MGGRAAEEMFVGQIATGALNDLERATKIAYSLVVYYGMSTKLPNVSYYDSTGSSYGYSKPYSEERSRIIDEEVSRILTEQYERAKEILRQYADGHNKLSQLLIEREVIFTADVEAIFGKRQWASRTDEILALNEHTDGNGESKPAEGSEATKSISEGEKANDTANNDNNDNNQTNG